MHERAIFRMMGAALVGASLLALIPAPIAAQRAPRANVHLVQHPVPARLSGHALAAFARRHQAPRLRGAADWRAQLVVAFDRAPASGFEVVFYELHDGERRALHRQRIDAGEAAQSTFRTPIELSATSGFSTDRRLEAVVVVDGDEVGRVRFGLVGG